MTNKVTGKVLRDLIIEVIKEATEDEARAEAQKVLDANPNAEIKDVVTVIRALGKADKTGIPSMRDAKRIAKEIFLADEPEVADEPQPPPPPPPQPSQKIKITYPVFNFDLFTMSDMDDSALGTYRQNQTAVYDMMHKHIIQSSTDPVTKIQSMVNFLENPLKFNIIDMDKDQHTDDDAVSIAFSSILMFKLLENITNRNESSMGFYLENWIALMIGGQAMQASAGSDYFDVKLGDSGYSLKFVLPESQVSQKTLKDVSPDSKIPYLIALKDKKQPSTITFYNLTPEAHVIYNGIQASKLVDGENPIATIDIAAINKKMKNLSSGSMKNVEQIYKNVESILDEMSNLQAFLAFWFQNFSDASTNAADKQELRDAADGIITSSKNCKNSIDFLTSKNLYKKGKTYKKSELTSAAQQVLSNNKGLVMDERLPNINLTQAFTEQLTPGQVTDTVLEEISDTLSKITGADLQETILKRVQYIQGLYDGVLNNNINTNDVSSLFNILILIQALFSFGALKASDVSTGDFQYDTHVGGATAGFTMEGFMGLLMSDGQTNPSARFQSFTAGGNQEKIDVAVIEQNPTGKNIVHGFSSKFRARNFYGDPFAGEIESLVTFKYTRDLGHKVLIDAYESLNEAEKKDFVEQVSMSLSYSDTSFTDAKVKEFLKRGQEDLHDKKFTTTYGKSRDSIFGNIRLSRGQANTRISPKLDIFWRPTLRFVRWDSTVESDPNLKSVLTKFGAETDAKARELVDTPLEQKIIKALADVPAIKDSGASEKHFVRILVGRDPTLPTRVGQITPSTKSYKKYNDPFERQLYTLQQALGGSSIDEVYRMYSKKGKPTDGGKDYVARGGNPKFDMSIDGYYTKLERARFFDLLETIKQEVETKIINKYEFKSYTAGAATDDSGEFSLFSGSGEIGIELGRLSLKAGNFQKFIDNLEAALNNVAVNFIASFKNFNEFKLATASFLQDPTAIGHIVCDNKYDDFRSHVNKVFSDTAVTNVQGTKAITEAVITAMMLQKLISESFKR